MKHVIGLIALIVGLRALVVMSIEEKDIKTHYKIMVAASLGATITGGLILLLI